MDAGLFTCYHPFVALLLCMEMGGEGRGEKETKEIKSHNSRLMTYELASLFLSPLLPLILPPRPLLASSCE